MVIIFLIVLGIIVLYFIGSSQQKLKPTSIAKKQEFESQYSIEKVKEEAKQIKIPTVASLIKNVKNIDDIEALEEESDEWLSKFQETGYEVSKYEKLYEVYREAYIKAQDIVFYYQYLPEIKLTSSKEAIENAYSVFSIGEIKQKKKEIGESSGEWIQITGNELLNDSLDNIIEQKPKYWDSLIKFKQIVESQAMYSEKKIMINELSASDELFTEEFFFLDENESAGDFWIKDLIRSYGVPLVDKLYEMGYDSPDKYVNLDIELIKNIKGFGTHRTEQLQKAIVKIKKQHK